MKLVAKYNIAEKWRLDYYHLKKNDYLQWNIENVVRYKNVVSIHSGVCEELYLLLFMSPGLGADYLKSIDPLVAKRKTKNKFCERMFLISISLKFPIR